MNEKLSQEALSVKLHAATEKVAVGSTYIHYKGGSYTVTGLGIEESTDEISVIYQANYGERLTFIRAISSWLETIKVNDTEIARFTKQ